MSRLLERSPFVLTGLGLNVNSACLSGSDFVAGRRHSKFAPMVRLEQKMVFTLTEKTSLTKQNKKDGKDWRI